MRISQNEMQAAVRVVRKHLGAASAVWLFGSRVDDAQKGGDIDLYVETDATNVALPVARVRYEQMGPLTQSNARFSMRFEYIFLS